MPLSLSLALLLTAPARAGRGPVVINEIMYNPPAALGVDEALEYVELYNRTDQAVDLTGYRLKDDVRDHTFLLPAGTVLPARGFLVVARSVADLRAVYGNGFAAVGDLPFPLGNGGDSLRLLDGGGLLDQVDYDDDPPWPPEADGQGSSLERIDPAASSAGFESFAASAPSSLPGTPGARNSRAGPLPARHQVVLNEIMYHPVKDPAADPLRHCEGEEFVELLNRGAEEVDLSGWRFTRGIDFTFPPGSRIPGGGYLVLYHDQAMFEAKYGRLANALGPYLGVLDDGGEKIILSDASSTPADFVDYDDASPWPVNPDGLRGSLELADPWEDNAGAGAWLESADFRGTPGAENSAHASLAAAGGNRGPRLSRPEHHPAADPDGSEITSAGPVRVTVRADDGDGVASVTLFYQVLPAGSYIRRTDPEFAASWTALSMDYQPGEGVYAALVPAQPHRTLVRYRFRSQDRRAPAAESETPHPADPEPNHAYFVYDGLPPYAANVRSDFGAAGYVHHGLDLLPVYHLIADGADIFQAQYVPLSTGDNTYRWRATLVFEGRVYDHLGIRLRGGVHRYHWPKRSWKIRFNKGNLFQGAFNDGSPYPRPRSKVNLVAEQHNDGRPRGESGVFESLAWKLFAEADVTSARTTFVQLRVIDDVEELDQYRGDFFGVFLDIEDIDDDLLARNDRPTIERASLYRFSDAGREKERSDCSADDSDVRAFIGGYTSVNTVPWYQANFDVARYLSFRSVVEFSHHYDMGDKNYYYYYNTDSSLWEMVPWDLDNTFGSDSGDGTEPFRDRVLPRFRVQYEGRLRFLWQTIFDQTRMTATIDGWAPLLSGIADADLDRWNREPYCDCAVDGDPPNCGSRGNQCGFYGKFQARMAALKSWIASRRTAVAAPAIGNVNDAGKPDTPVNLLPAAGAPTSLEPTLAASPYRDSQGNAHLATHWLVVPLEDPEWTAPTWERLDGSGGEEARVPPQVLSLGVEYLFRARYQDATGRWSFLSAPTSFIAGGDKTPPSPPGGLAGQLSPDGAVDLEWTASADAESGLAGYKVERDEVTLTPVPVTGTSYRDLTAAPGGVYRYRVFAVNRGGLESAPSDPVTVEVPAPPSTFVRGDASGDGVVDLADPLAVLFHLFAGGDLLCLDSADADDSGREDLSDAVRLLEYLFLAGSSPAAPFPACGADLTADDLSSPCPERCP